MKIVIVSALQDELRPLQRQLEIAQTYQQGPACFAEGLLGGMPVILGHTGMGRQATREGLKMLLRLVSVQAVLGVGYAGALQAEMPAGSLVLATECFAEEAGRVLPTDPCLVERCRTVLQAQQQAFFAGRLLTCDQALITSEQKKAAGGEYAAIAVDMESAALAALCHEHSIPFVVCRAILDPLEMSVPDPKHFVNSEHRIAKRRIFSFIADKPEAVWDLPRLASHAAKARRQLTAIIPRLLTAINENHESRATSHERRATD